MANAKNTGTKNAPLRLASILNELVNAAWSNGELLERVSPVSGDLLRFWFDEAFCEQRGLNFHAGQRQAILNAIYCHEVLGVQNTLELYERVDEMSNLNLHKSADLFDESSLFENLKSKKFTHPKYCIKMATGTGKTWVLNALLIWQYLNASLYGGELGVNFGGNSRNLEKNSRGEGENSQNAIKFSKNFLIVAPGLIVYERLVDSFCGKEREDGSRDFESSDICKNEALFLPKKYAERVKNFLQNSVLDKADLANKRRKNDGMIAITNWHLLVDEEDEAEEVSVLKNPKAIIDELLPISPGTSGGNSLEALDMAARADVLGFLREFNELCVFNDEAHHIHENKSGGIASEVEWQKSLNALAQNKGRNFIQIDFSATPYNITGSGQKRQRHYFEHIISDFGLKEAIYGGLVKMIAIDKRKELASLENTEIDFKAKRDENDKVIALSAGQRLMLSAGLAKLQLLEREFAKMDENKKPKMLVICEETAVSPFVVEFLKEQGLSDEDLMQIDSNKKGEVKESEWKGIKQRLFNIDKHTTPKVIISVLMLREGFDVNNICVVVPLRSSQSLILLEQVIGRGLRLMWRESDYAELKKENLQRVLFEKKAPNAYLDILSIIEHPAFLEFYEDLENEIVVETDGGSGGGKVLGDMIKVGLRQNYAEFDMYMPKIINDEEEILRPLDSVEYKFEPVPHSLAKLKEWVKDYKQESFQSQEITIGTRFGEYKVDATLFNAQSYNEFLVKIANAANSTKRAAKQYPLMQFNAAQLIGIVDKFIRNGLFNEPFEPLFENNWRILMLHKNGITQHIFKQINEFLYRAQQNIDIKKAVVKKEFFSQVSELKMRSNFALDIAKSIYEKTPYPSNKGGFEKDFLEFCDNDTSVDKIIKINEHYHDFAHLYYIRTDGILASYCADFIVQSGECVYLVETKAQRDLNNENVKQKRKSALNYCSQINALDACDRMGAKWSYHLLDDNTFYALKNKDAAFGELLRACELVSESLFDERF